MTPKTHQIVFASSITLLLGLGVFLAMPSPIDPLAYEVPEPPSMEGPLAPNEALRSARVLAAEAIRGAEDVAVDAEGRLYGGAEDGRIWRLTLGENDSEQLEEFCDTGGRPLGLHFDANGHLVVADAAKGLLSVNPKGQITVLTTEAGGLPFRFTDDLDIASDGRIYFSDASWRHDHHHYLYDLMEARPYGRLLRYDPARGTTEVLLKDLYFANGIALSQHEDFVLVNETYRYRITRYWLQGPMAGQHDVFMDNLPGFPDGVSSNRSGTFWVALFTVRNGQVDDLLHPRPFFKWQLAKLPRFLWPKPEPYGLVLAVDEKGNVLRSLQDPGGEVVSQTTSAEEANGHLYLGNLTGRGIARLKL